MPPHPMQPIVMDGKVARFKVNKIVRFLYDTSANKMNELAVMPFSLEDRVQFAQLIGYSVDGAAELSYMPRELIVRADREVHRLQVEKQSKTKRRKR